MVSFSFPMDEGSRVNDWHPDIEILRKPWLVLPARASASIPGPQSVDGKRRNFELMNYNSRMAEQHFNNLTIVPSDSKTASIE